MRCAITLALALAGCAGARQTVSMPAGGARVPFALAGNVPLVHVRLGRHADIVAIVDTGAERLIVSPEAAQRADLALTSRSIEVDGIDRVAKRTLSESRPTRVSVGDISFRLRTLVIPEMQAFAEAMGEEVDAFLGGALFGPFLLTIDYPARMLRLEQGALPQPNGVDVLAATFNGTPSVPIQVAGVTLTAVIDSGCNGTFHVPAALAKTLPIRGTPLGGGEGIGANGVNRVLSARLNGSIRLGGYDFVDPVLDYGRSARICGKVLREFAITLDPTHGRVRFARARPGPIALAPDRTLGFGARKHGGRWVVVSLRTAFAPPAVAAGDVVVSMNGRVCSTMTADDVGAVLREASTVRLVLDRAGQRTEVEVPVIEVGAR